MKSGSPKHVELKEEFIKYNHQKGSLGKTHSESCCKRFWKIIFPCCRNVNITERRAAFIQEIQYNLTVYSNKLSNNKYNPITFIFLILYNQFRFFGNQFYLLMTITQFIDELKVGFLFSYLSPLLIVIFVTMIKEMYDDIKRYLQDKKTNNVEYIKIARDEVSKTVKHVKVKAMDIQIGDLLELTQNQRIPADMILLKAYAEGNEEEGSNVFIRTDQLDGETDWKLRKAPAMTQKLNEEEISDLTCGYIISDPPLKDIYKYEGTMYSFDNDHNARKEGLSLENTLWASTIFASKKAIGIVIYTGIETRSQMNQTQPKVKVGVLDNEINFLNKMLFGIMFLLALIITCSKGFGGTFWYICIVFFRFIVLFCGIIPISLRVNLDISKAFFAVSINKDKDIPETIVRNSTIPEELGRITYVFTDKTGTLTKNEMIFKKIAMETDQFTEDNFDELKTILTDECDIANAPLLDVFKKMSSDSLIIDTTSSADAENKKPKRTRRPRTKLIRESIEAMAVCNNVTPIKDDQDPTKVTYQASSPDEVALVTFADSLDMKLSYRTDKVIHLMNSAGILEEFEILANFPFSSDTKRMGILLKNKKHGHLIFYLKGAENVIENFVKDEYKSYIRENAENLACVGLRTLVLTQKLVSQSFYDDWNIKYQDALASLENRKDNVARVIEELEHDMDFLCVTGVEDLLQDDVGMIIENLRNAGMKIWMLTGDKIETATCISISAGIKGKSQKLFYIRSDELRDIEGEDRKIEALNNKLNDFKHLEPLSHVLIIDGISLELCLSNLEAEFFVSAMQAPSVVCCRCSPTQKSQIVQRIKKYTDKITCAIGDGGNDVAMIQQADVGIGIVGKEGLQASFASDFSILKFNYLNNLLLWWGRIAYKNTSTMCNFVMHRGLIISLIQFIFSIMFYSNAVALYNGMLMLGYSTIYTNFPAMAVCMDRDTDISNVVKFPGLYKRLLLGRELNTKQFLFWFGKSIFQAGVIMIGSILLFDDKIYLKLVTVTFTELIFIELLNVYTEIHKFNWVMILSLVGTFIAYLLTLLLFPAILDVYFIFDWLTFAKILLISVSSWILFYAFRLIQKFCYPETHEKLNELKHGDTIKIA